VDLENVAGVGEEIKEKGSIFIDREQCEPKKTTKRYNIKIRKKSSKEKNPSYFSERGKGAKGATRTLVQGEVKGRGGGTYAAPHQMGSPKNRGKEGEKKVSSALIVGKKRNCGKKDQGRVPRRKGGGQEKKSALSGDSAGPKKMLTPGVIRLYLSGGKVGSIQRHWEPGDLKTY